MWKHGCCVNPIYYPQSTIYQKRFSSRTVFDLSPEEWQATYDLLQQAKRYLDDEPLAGKGLRFPLEQPANERAQPEEH